jgi:soluble P-type ATPase
MTVRLEIPGSEPIALDHLLLDLNGTLTDRGELIDGVEDRLGRLRSELEILLLSADTLGTLDALARRLQIEARRVLDGSEKRELVERLGPDRCAAIGNGRNDAEILGTVRLGLAVIGPEGASVATLSAADIVVTSILVALDLLLERSLAASTLRP